MKSRYHQYRDEYSKSTNLRIEDNYRVDESTQAFESGKLKALGSHLSESTTRNASK